MSTLLGRITPAQIFRTISPYANLSANRAFSTTSAALARRRVPQLVYSLPRLSRDILERSMPVTECLGANPKQLTFRQGKIENCYFLSTLDAIQHHPLANWLMRGIRIEEVSPKPGESAQAVNVYFPSQRIGNVQYSQIGQPSGLLTPVQGHPIFQLLELAFGKIISRERNQKPEFAPKPFPNEGRDNPLELQGCGLPSDAMAKMLVGHQLARFTRGYADPALLSREMGRIVRDKKDGYLLCAITQGEGEGGRVFELPPREDGQPRNIKRFLPYHSYSIRNPQANNGMVTVADPHDTENLVETLTLEEFGKVFTCVDGIKFKMPVK